MSKLKSTNPAMGYEVIGEIEQSTEQEIVSAVRKAKEAQPAWAELSIERRVAYYKKLIPIYEKRVDEIAEMQTRETGKPITQSIADVKSDVNWIEAKLSLALKYLQPDIVDESETQTNTVFFEPYGVAAVIAPWNFPTSNFFISTTHLLLAGNTVVFKHSEECVLTSKLLAELFEEAGFPEGVLSVVYGDGEVGKILVQQDVNILHFTGSSKTGEYLYKVAAEKFIPVILEMGGSSPGIIFADADLSQAVSSVCLERYNNCGQICSALKRLIVHKDIYDQVVKMLIDQVKGMKVGDPMDKDTFLGPLVAERQLVLLEEQVKDALEKGAKVEIGGGKPENLNGAYYNPTVLTNITKGMKVYKDEVFGPVLPVIAFGTEEEAIELANDTIYGLSAFVYTSDKSKADRVASKIKVGNVSINGASYFSDGSPFGGYKKSGMGSNDGKYGFQQVTRMKTVGKPK